MANVTRWNPFAELEDILDRYSRSRYPRVGGENGTLSRDLLQRTDWAPAVDISETPDAFHIHAEVPGVNKDDIKVTLQDGVLTIQGERREEKPAEEGSKQHRVERFYGSFARSFTLPESVDEDGVEAEYKDGILNLKLRKSEKAKPRAIDVKVA